ncbi:MAG TPA: TadG family pilus assembly protein [Devosia sp.]|nr:TadG family pilus assembly protein [Devosia sp.]
MIGSFLRDGSGNMALLFAAAFSLSGLIGAIAVDAAALYHERRVIQSSVDLAAISAARNPSRAKEIAADVLARAGFADQAGLVVTIGRFEADATRAPADRFVPNSVPANAVKVQFERPGTLYFASSFTQAPMVGATGLATVTPEVSFSLGSRVASLNGGIANALLGALLGTTVNLSVLDYNNLAAARVDALSFLDALAFKMGITAGTYNDLLAAKVYAGDIAAALAGLVNGTEKTALTTLTKAGKGNRVPLGKLFDLGHFGSLALGSAGAALNARISVLEVLSAAAALADGERQAALSLGGNLPGIAALTVELSVGEPPQGGGWFAIGPVDKVVRTAQVRLRIEAQFLGGLVLQSALVRLPLWLDLAPAEARVAAVSCPDRANPNGTADIAVLPGALELAIGKVTNAQMRNFGAALPVTPVRILDALLLDISASARVKVAQTTPVLLKFSSGDIGAAQLKTAKTTTLVTSLGQSLLGDLTLDISILGLGLSPLNVIANALKTLIAPIAAPLDSIVNTLLTALGLGIGEADVRVYGVRCLTPVLVG